MQQQCNSAENSAPKLKCKGSTYVRCPRNPQGERYPSRIFYRGNLTHRKVEDLGYSQERDQNRSRLNGSSEVGPEKENVEKTVESVRSKAFQNCSERDGQQHTAPDGGENSLFSIDHANEEAEGDLDVVEAGDRWRKDRMGNKRRIRSSTPNSTDSSESGQTSQIPEDHRDRFRKKTKTAQKMEKEGLDEKERLLAKHILEALLEQLREDGYELPRRPRERGDSAPSDQEGLPKREISPEPEKPKKATIFLGQSSEGEMERNETQSRRKGACSRPIPLARESEENKPSRVIYTRIIEAIPVSEPEGNPEDDSIVVLNAEQMEYIQMWKRGRARM